MNSNSQNFLKHAGELIKGAIADAEGLIKESQEARDKAAWEATCNLICHAALNVFDKGYKKPIAKQFKQDVAQVLGISEKQASKYTETISAALGVRMDKGGLKGGGIKGLRVPAMVSPDEVAEFCSALEITTLGGLRRACQKDKDPIETMARQFQKLETDARDEVLKLVKELDAAPPKVAKEAAAKAHKATPKATKVNGVEATV